MRSMTALPSVVAGVTANVRVERDSLAAIPSRRRSLSVGRALSAGLALSVVTVLLLSATASAYVHEWGANR